MVISFKSSRRENEEHQFQPGFILRANGFLKDYLLRVKKASDRMFDQSKKKKIPTKTDFAGEQA